MKRLYRSLAHNYSAGGLTALLRKVLEAFTQRIWSRTEWMIYTQDAAAASEQQGFISSRRVLGFDDLLSIGYPKALAFPEDIRQRFSRGDRCYGFFANGGLATLGWVREGHLELDRWHSIECVGAWGLYDFVTMPDYRGKGFYTDALRQLVSIARHTGASARIAVDPGNAASIKGIERAGFQKSTKTTLSRFLGISRLGNEPIRAQ
jgi:GNAT superfamily N-acetyltransferase